MHLRFSFLYPLCSLFLMLGPNLHGQDITQTGEVAPYAHLASRQDPIDSFDYRHSNGKLKIELGGTALMPKAQAQAIVRRSAAGVEIDLRAQHLTDPRTVDPVELTFVVWALSTNGQIQNLGELREAGGMATLTTVSQLPAFALVVTAEPYFAVTRPSEYIVLYNLLRIHQEDQSILRADLLPLRADPSVPLDLFEARNAVRIARQAGAERYAAENFRKAAQLLQQAEGIFAATRSNRSGDQSTLEATARQATLVAESARLKAAQISGTAR